MASILGKRKPDEDLETRPAKRLNAPPPIGLMSLSLELREKIYEDVLGAYPSIALVQFDDDSFLRTDHEGKSSNEHNPKNIRFTFWAKVLPKEFFLSKKILYEASLALLRHTKLQFWHDAVEPLHEYLATFPNGEGYKNVRRLELKGYHLVNWGKGHLSPHSIIARCPGLREVIVPINHLDLHMYSGYKRDHNSETYYTHWFLPQEFEEKYRLMKLATLEGPLTIVLKLIYGDYGARTENKVRSAFEPYLAALKEESQRRGHKVIIEPVLLKQTLEYAHGTPN